MMRSRLARLGMIGLLMVMSLTGAGCRSQGACQPRLEEQSVRPGINDPYKTTPAEDWVQRFEVESREIFRERTRITDWVGLRPGQRVADIGAGTGLFVPLFAERVGKQGVVYAVDIMPGFLEHIERKARDAGLKQVRTVLCKEDSVELKEHSIDVAFICDTYHHFEYPRSTMASIARALRPGGQVIVVDFIRIPGVSRDWIIDHVRCGKEEVIAEIESDGFMLVESVEPDFLEENYLLRFEKPDLRRKR